MYLFRVLSEYDRIAKYHRNSESENHQSSIQNSTILVQRLTELQWKTPIRFRAILLDCYWSKWELFEINNIKLRLNWFFCFWNTKGWLETRCLFLKYQDEKGKMFINFKLSKSILHCYYFFFFRKSAYEAVQEAIDKM